MDGEGQHHACRHRDKSGLDEASGERLSDCRDAMSPAQLADFYRSFGQLSGAGVGASLATQLFNGADEREPARVLLTSALVARSHLAAWTWGHLFKIPCGLLTHRFHHFHAARVVAIDNRQKGIGTI